MRALGVSPLNSDLLNCGSFGGAGLAAMVTRAVVIHPAGAVAFGAVVCGAVGAGGLGGGVLTLVTGCGLAAGSLGALAWKSVVIRA